MFYWLGPVLLNDFNLLLVVVLNFNFGNGQMLFQSGIAGLIIVEFYHCLVIFVSIV